MIVTLVAATLEGGTDAAVQQAQQRPESPRKAGLQANDEIDVTQDDVDIRASVKSDVLFLIPDLPIHVNVASAGSTERWNNS